MESNSTLPCPLSAKFKNSFAYKTLVMRLPVIITKVIDLLYRQRKQIPLQLAITNEECGAAEEETKSLIEELAKLKYELQTNKSLQFLDLNITDKTLWNDYLKEQILSGKEVTYFNVSWLYAECYIYRRMHEIFVSSKYFKNYDQFFSIKQELFVKTINIASMLAQKLKNIKDNQDKNAFSELFYFYSMTSLWGNKFDLSLSCGEQNENKNNDFKEMDKKILVNDLEELWNYVHNLSLSNSDNFRIDIVLDNAGYELFTDLCLVEFLHLCNLFPKENSKVYFHVKKMPWFVSDTMSTDIKWMLNFANENPDCEGYIKEICSCFKENFKDNIWIVEENDFWTLPHDFSKMPTLAPNLFENLSQSNLVIFKGDLNYRKLVGDLKWNYNTCFKDALRDFLPNTAISSFRTIKADVVCGIHDENLIQKINSEFPTNWMETGEYAVIHFLNNKSKNKQ